VLEGTALSYGLQKVNALLFYLKTEINSFSKILELTGII
jgi:hypothetical protein